MKKHLALVLALVMVLTSFSFVSAAPDFSDMEGHVNAEAVARLELLNVLKGYPDGTFKPDDTITRAEFAAVAVRVSGLENVAMAAKGLPTGFTDVPAHHWASGYVGTAAKTGIVVGIGNGLFAPESPVKYEEAITMVVRALGYEPMAQARGGYPFGYLIVANEIDLLDGAMGTQGTWATRGFVAQITDNALEIPMMIQVGYGSDTKWVVSGKEDTDEEFLLDRMGFDTFEGRIVDVDEDDMEVKIDDEGDNDWYNVSAGFDFFATEGVTVKVWADGDDIIAYNVLDTVLFGAVDANVDLDEIEMVESEDEYDVAARVDVADADYAKVVIGDDDEVVWFAGYMFDDFMLVEEVDDDMVYDLNDEELDLEDYLVTKDGKTISVEDLEVGDVLFYDESEEFAVVYNLSETGEIDRVYDATSFRMDGTRYDFSELGAMYLDGEDLDDLEEDIVRGMMDEDKDVELFFDTYGDVVLAVGDTGVADTSTFYAYVTTVPTNFTVRTREYFNLDVVTEFGEEVKFDVDYTTDSAIDFNKGDVIEVTVDEDGDYDSHATIDGSYNPADTSTTTNPVVVETDDAYAGAFRLQSSAVVFWVEEFLDSDDVDDIKVMTWAEAADEFDEVINGEFYPSSTNRVAAVAVNESDASADNTEHFGLVTGLRKISNKTQYEVIIEVEGTEYEFLTDTDESFTWINTTVEKSLNTVEVGDFATIEVDDNSNLIEVVAFAGPDATETVEEVDSRANTLTTSGGAVTYRLVDDAVVYDADDDIISLRDVEAEDMVEVYLDNTVSGSVWVMYLRVLPAGSAGEEAVTGDATVAVVYNVNDTTIALTVDGALKSYNIASDSTSIVVKNAEGDFVPYTTAIPAGSEVNFTLVEGTQTIGVLEVVSVPE